MPTQSEHTQSEHTQSEHTQTEHTQTEHTQTEHTQSEPDLDEATLDEASPEDDAAHRTDPARTSLGRRLRRRWARLQDRAEAGMSTAEYAVGTVAACAFAAVLYRVVSGDSIVTALGDLVDRALSTLS
jgi:glutathione S-transferase